MITLLTFYYHVVHTHTHFIKTILNIFNIIHRNIIRNSKIYSRALHAQKGRKNCDDLFGTLLHCYYTKNSYIIIIIIIITRSKGLTPIKPRNNMWEQNHKWILHKHEYNFVEFVMNRLSSSSKYLKDYSRCQSMAFFYLN